MFKKSLIILIILIAVAGVGLTTVSSLNEKSLLDGGNYTLYVTGDPHEQSFKTPYNQDIRYISSTDDKERAIDITQTDIINGYREYTFIGVKKTSKPVHYTVTIEDQNGSEIQRIQYTFNVESVQLPIEYGTIQAYVNKTLYVFADNETSTNFGESGDSYDVIKMAYYDGYKKGYFSEVINITKPGSPDIKGVQCTVLKAGFFASDKIPSDNCYTIFDWMID
jgi:hypothetical protein